MKLRCYIKAPKIVIYFFDAENNQNGPGLRQKVNLLILLCYRTTKGSDHSLCLVNKRGKEKMV